MDFNAFIPYPYSKGEDLSPGWLLGILDTCHRCKHRNCTRASDSAIEMCSYGLNYLKLGYGIILLGFIVREQTVSSPARTKAIKNNPGHVVSKIQVKSFIARFEAAHSTLLGTIQSEKQEILNAYIEKEMHKEDFLQQINPAISQGLSSVHDYKQINRQISHNINIIMESKYQDGSIDDKLKQASYQETAIYHASKLLDEKLNVAKFLLQPQWLNETSQCIPTRPHGIIVKYVRIYEALFSSRELTISVIGESYSDVVANPQALSVIPHTLIDNAVKYSQKKGKITIELSENEQGILFSVTSHGPKIETHEQAQIFHPFFRGQHAQQMDEEGAGYGLYVSQLIAKKHLGSQINIEQSATPDGNRGYLTTFSILLPYKAAILI